MNYGEDRKRKALEDYSIAQALLSDAGYQRFVDKPAEKLRSNALKALRSVDTSEGELRWAQGVLDALDSLLSFEEKTKRAFNALVKEESEG